MLYLEFSETKFSTSSFIKRFKFCELHPCILVSFPLKYELKKLNNDEPIIDIFDLISLLLDIDEESQDDCSKISADMDDNDVLNNIDIGILIALIFG